MVESIPQSAYRYTREFQGKYTGNSSNREPTPVFHLWIDTILTTPLVRPIGRIVEAFVRIAGLERTIGPFPANTQHCTTRSQGWLRLLGQKFFRDKWTCLSG
jgi:hypothetical protein